MQSMTGFGKGTCIADGREITIELKAVNHRFLDINMRLPRTLGFLEDEIRRTIQSKLSRGHIEVWITYNNTRQDAHTVEVDMGILSAYMKAFDNIKDNYNVNDDISLSVIARLPDVFNITESQDDTDALQVLTHNATELAADELIKMRNIEGERLLDDIKNRVILIESALSEITKKAPLVVLDYKNKLRKRITELMDDVVPDETRFNQEVAFFADKCAIDEEIVRLQGHIDHVRETFIVKEPVGRKLDFLIQEMNRESNTIGSKASDMDILNNVVLIKSEIEKLREQIQNIE